MTLPHVTGGTNGTVFAQVASSREGPNVAAVKHVAKHNSFIIEKNIINNIVFNFLVTSVYSSF
jgi:hypothetical protein